jgi:hypothetical protein
VTRVRAGGGAWALLLALLLSGLAAPAAAGGPGFSAGGASGDGPATFLSPDAVVVAPFGARTLDLEGDAGLLEVVDDRAEAVKDPRRPPSSQQSLMGFHNRTVESRPLQGFGLVVDEVLDADAVALVVPLSADYAVAVEHDGGYALAATPDKLLEASHYAGDDVGNTEYRYEFRSGEALELALAGATGVTVSGDFKLYLWGLAATVFDAGGASEARTGYSRSASSAGSLPVAEAYVVRDHFVHALVTVHGGTLRLRGADAGTALYGQDITGSGGDVAYRDAAGAVPLRGGGGGLVHEGDAVVTGGTHAWSLEEGGRIGVAFAGPTAVAGASVAPLPAPLLSGPVRTALGAAALGLALAAAYLAPTATGAWHLRRDARRTGEPAPRGLRAARSEGYAHWAVRAEGRGARRLAALWMGLAVRAERENPTRALDWGVYLREAGRPRRALAAHRHAHFWFQARSESDQLAFNAYEAAKAAALDGQVVAAIDWIRVAIEADAALAAPMRQEPAFASLRAHPDYLSLSSVPAGAGVLARA